MKELAKDLGIKGYSRNELIDLTEKRSNSVIIIKFRIRLLEMGWPERLSVVSRIENTNFDDVTFKIHYESQIPVTTKELPSPLGHKAY